MDDVNAELLDLIFEAERRGLIKIRTKGADNEHGGVSRAKLMDLINGSAWLKDRRGEPSWQQVRAEHCTALIRFREHLLENDGYRDPEHDPVVYAINARLALVQKGHA